MVKNQTGSKLLIKETFQNPFSKGSFVYFVKNLLNHIEEAPFIYRGNLIPDAFDPYIKTLERVGKYQDSDNKQIDILIVHLKKETSLEHARTMQRNFVAWYLNGSRGGKLKDAALVAFVSPDKNDWRFSLVKMEYKLAKTQTGRIRAREELTPARRYSYLVGVNESSHTAQSKLVPILEDDANNPTLKQLEEAFNIERVTKEFFEKYRELYIKVKEELDNLVSKDNAIKNDFSKKSVSVVDFSKKLLGQIVFLYFLQKKGWFGVKHTEKWGTGSKGFLRELFDKKHGNYQNFFNDILEPLFYEALRRERQDDYYSRFDCRIPFLNGGLFDPLNDYDWIDTDILLPNEFFSNNEKTKEGDTGTGILDIFDRYNFTVKEDEPLEKEVAVDPEMLGKVFENLLEVKDRKSKGTYYTPREIVHYMCQESLINYLYTELNQDSFVSEEEREQSKLIGKPDPKQMKLSGRGKKKKEIISKEDIETLIKYGETAIEHEAEVISKDKETKRYSHKFPKAVRDNAELIDEKLTIIRVCDPAVGSGAFLVGMMNEIIRARNALTSYFKEKKNRTMYNFKRHAIQNCLYGVDIDPGAVEIAKLRLWLSLVVDEEDIKQIKPLPNLDYKIMRGNSLLGIEKEKMGVRNMFYEHMMSELKDTKQLYFNETNVSKKQEYREKIDDLMNKITNGHKDFDFEVYFAEIFNEKNGFDIVIANPPYVKKENLDTQTIEELESVFNEEKNGQLKPWSDDLYVHFIFKGIEITKSCGILTYITNDSFLGFMSKQRVRDLLLQYNLEKLIRCPKETFQATIYTAVFLLRKNKSADNSYETSYFEYPGFVHRVLGNIPYKIINTLPNKRLVFYNTILEIYEKLLDVPRLKQYLNVLDTGIHSGNIRDKIFFKEKIRQNFNRLLQGRQIKRWGIFWNSSDAKYKYCDINYKPKKIRGIGRKGQASKSDEYWHFCGNPENHHQPERLLMRQSDDNLIVAYHNESEMGKFYTDNTLFTLLSPENKVSLKFAMALLNSKLLNKIYDFFAQEEGKTLAQVKTGIVDELPFIVKNQNQVIKIVDKILAITKDEDYLENPVKQAKVRDYEKQIDKLVYKLYDLTPKEIKIVEE